jgi:hypothetical protein
MKMTLLLMLFSISGAYAQLDAITPDAEFEKDVAHNTIQIYILGGIAAHVYEHDAGFEAKYQVTFYDFGCLAPGNLSFYRDYNLLVFKYLLKQHGEAWEKEIRKDVMGWNKWKPEDK